MLTDLKKISAGSVKDIYSAENSSDVHFIFSDRISVFDYGPIPENIPDRGKNLAAFAKKIFSVLKVPHLYLGDSPLGDAAFRMKKCTHKKFPDLGMNEYEFVPLEVIFRWGVPAGSKMLKRGYKLFEEFSGPKIEFTTKLEAFDRDLSLEEAATLLPSGLKMNAIEGFAHEVATQLRDYFAPIGLKLWDGKLECAWDKNRREIALVDAFTPDEVRLTHPKYPAVPLSKELLRRWYQKTLWPTELEKLKIHAGSAWKNNAPVPPALGAWRMQRLSALYGAFTQTVTSGNSQALLDWIEHDTTKPKVHVVGQGGRETALRWKLSREACEMSDMVSSDAIWVGQDADLEAGMINKLSAEGRWVFGPTREAARVEWSKIFGKNTALRAEIPTAKFTLNPLEASTWNPLPVIKQDGLAAGKGVALPKTKSEFTTVVSEWKDKKLLFEERFSGEEASAFFYIHPKGSDFDVVFLGSAKDFKRRFEGDEGPNTGGMGALAPHPTLSDADVAFFQTCAHRTALSLASEENILFSGILFMGFLRDKDTGWQLLEYNARLGDPETEALVGLWGEDARKGPEDPTKRSGGPIKTFLGLSVEEKYPAMQSNKKSLCVALVHPEYPAKAKAALSLPEWHLHEDNAELFMSGGFTGRIAYLCLVGESFDELRVCAKKIMDDSPWKNLVAWRKDI